ncbi:hypothetical protein Golob_010992, partial [Gossypium lobatum]|nr:hypothetical protein [Gossypium lobatum]
TGLTSRIGSGIGLGISLERGIGLINLQTVELTRRGIGHDLACGLCDHGPEDVLHAIRDCPVAARNIWDQLIPLDWYSRFYAGNIHEWLDSNLENQHDWCLGDVDWQCLFGITAWRIWKNLKFFIFQGASWSVSETIKPLYIFGQSSTYLLLWGKMNETRAEFAAAGRIVCDRDGEWILGYNRFMGYDKVLIQSDCLKVVIAIQANSLEMYNSALIRRIHQVLFWFRQ